MTRVSAFLRCRPAFARVVFIIAFFVSLSLFIAGFCVPPYGMIDGSVLSAGGILLGFATFSMLPDIISSGRTIRLSHGETNVVVGEEKYNQLDE